MYRHAGIVLTSVLCTLAVPTTVLAVAMPLEGDPEPNFLANWMANMGGLIANQTLLDLSLPGSHDTMTYDLSTALSDGYEGLPSIVTTILHELTPLVAGKFIRDQGRTQGLNITEQLDGGVRFIDFRIMFTSAEHKLTKDWYCL